MITQFSFDLLNEFEFSELKSQLPAYDVIFTDPPWGDGALNLFRNHVNKMGKSGSWVSLIEKLVILCQPTKYGALIQMGKRFTPATIDIFRDNGIVLLGQWEGVYGAKSTPLDYLYFGGKEVLQFNDDFLTGLDSRHEVGMKFLSTIPTHNGKPVVFDPFTGLGDVCWVCNKLGLDLVVNEINPKRLERALKLYKNA